MTLANRRNTLTRLAGLAAATTLAPWAVHAETAPPATLQPTSQPLAQGRLEVHNRFPSSEIAPRTLSVWLPPDYAHTQTRHAVLYMHDARNLFDPATAMRGETWGVAGHVAALVKAGKMRPTIVVGIDHGDQRWREYAPAAPLRTLSPALQRVARGDASGDPTSDAYLRFMVNELKPFIDRTYRTRTGRDDTAVMGASMGGLISLYALASYPDIFGAAGCLSTHWPLANDGTLLYPTVDARVHEIAGANVAWLAQHLPQAGAHRLYFDHGTINLDRLYGPFQQNVDALVSAKAYRRGHDWRSDVIAGADHNEPAWRARLATPLQFLLRA